MAIAVCVLMAEKWAGQALHRILASVPEAKTLFWRRAMMKVNGILSRCKPFRQGWCQAGARRGRCVERGVWAMMASGCMSKDTPRRTSKGGGTSRLGVGDCASTAAAN